MLTCILLKLQSTAPRWKAKPGWKDAGLSALLSNPSLHCTWLFVKVNIFSSIADGGDFLAPATFKRLDLRFGAGRWLAVGREVGLVQKVWGAAHKCNWSLGIFTWGLINMPLKHSRHICPTEQRQRQIIMIRNFFILLLWIFYQQLTDKVSGCLGCLTLMWTDKALLSCYLQKARPD